jgi:hypothetical protein
VDLARLPDGDYHSPTCVEQMPDLTYHPEAAYSGADAFIVEVFGRATFAKGQPRNGKFAFQVDVRAAP